MMKSANNIKGLDIENIIVLGFLLVNTLSLSVSVPKPTY